MLGKINMTVRYKINYFESLLKKHDGSYYDRIKEELHNYFFELENELQFLDKLNTKKEIDNSLNILLSKIVMHEDEDIIENIIHFYLS